MLNTLKYSVEKVERSCGEARITNLENSVFASKLKHPSVMFNVESKEDLEAIHLYYFNHYPSDKICGFVLPFHNLELFSGVLIDYIPKDLNLLCDIQNEAFWFGDLREDIKKFYAQYNALPQEIKGDIKAIQDTKNFRDKVEKHKQLWEKITSKDSHFLHSVIAAFIKPQITYPIRTLETTTPILFDKDHIDLGRECYDYAKKLYHEDERDIEKTGKIIAYTAHIHKNFLRDRTNIDELVNAIQAVEPKGIIFKLMDVDDIRHEPDLIPSYNYLIRSVRTVSDTLQIPSYYLSTHTEGLIATTRGVDAFSQPFNRVNNVSKEFRASKETMKKLWQQNPQLSSGRIYDYVTKEIVPRHVFEKKMAEQNGNVVNAPLGELSNYTIDQVKNMTPKHFRMFSKMYLMAARNLEMQEVHGAINTDTLRQFRSKFKFWVKDLTLFPNN